MALDLDNVFSQGGVKLIALLQHAARAAQADLLFVFLTEEYRQAPTAAKAVALYRGFCVPDAPARLSNSTKLPPLNLQLAAAMRPLEQSVQPLPAGSAAQPLRLPPKFLFDEVSLHIRKHSVGLKVLRRDYRMRKSPVENLPGGRMTEGQRYFLDKIWTPILRPRLVAAGFRRVASVG